MPAPDYIDWLYDAVCFKASHNSYLGLNGKPQDPATWNFQARYDIGCRGFELDVYQCDPATAGTDCEWSVSHEGEGLGQGCWPFNGYLDRLRKWSGVNPGHDPVFITLDLKSVRQPYEKFAEELDDYIASTMQQLLWSPAALLAGGAPDLVRAVQDARHGWPSIADLLGKFIFCLSGSGMPSRAAYASHRPHERLCFADMDRPEDVAMTQETLKSGNQVIINVRSDQRYWGTVWQKHNPGFLLRVYGLGVGDWPKVAGKGPNILATDAITKLTVGPRPFARSGR